MNENEIQQQCIERYVKNINFLEEKYPNVFRKLGLFELALDKQEYLEKYTLEYTDYGFDIKSLKDDNFIYNKNLDEHSSARADKIKLDDSNSFKLFNPINVPKKYNIPKDITTTYLETLYPLVDFVKKNISNDFTINQIEKFVFFGTLLGKHIESICSKFNPRVIMIIEPNIEIFKLSLFTTDYSSLNIKSDIVFAIANDNEELNSNIELFLKQYDYYNYLIKFDVIDSYYTYLFDNIANIIANKSPTHFPFSTRIMSMQRHVNLLNNNYKFINFHKTIETIQKKPILIVAPGPSLEVHAQWLKEHQDRFILVALGASLKTLYKHNIKPDIITTIDPNPIILNQYDNISEDFYSNCILFASTNTPNEIIDKFKKDKVFIYQAIYDLLDNTLFYGKSIGETTYRILLLLGVQRLYLLGTDLCVDEKTGTTHIKEHIHYKEIENLKKHNLLEDKIIDINSLIEVDGSKSNKVYTTRIFYDILELYKKFEQSVPSDTRKIYNISNGAKISNVDPIEVSNIKLPHIDKQKEMQELLLNLNKSYVDIDKHFNYKVQASLKTGQKILKLLKSYKNSKFKSYNDMMYAKLTITIEIIKLSKKDKNKVAIDLIASYNDNVEQYVSVFFNTKENQENKDKFNTFFKYWLKPQIILFKKYIDILN